MLYKVDLYIVSSGILKEENHNNLKLSVLLLKRELDNYYQVFLTKLFF